MTWLAAAVGVAMCGAAFAGAFPLAGAAYSFAGLVNSCFFATRSEYAPAEARGQVLVWIGALKIAAGPAGTAVAGTLW